MSTYLNIPPDQPAVSVPELEQLSAIPICSMEGKNALVNVGHNILLRLNLRLVWGLGQGSGLGLGERRADGDTVDNCGSLSLTTAGTLSRVSVSLSPNHGL